MPQTQRLGLHHQRADSIQQRAALIRTRPIYQHSKPLLQRPISRSHTNQTQTQTPLQTSTKKRLVSLYTTDILLVSGGQITVNGGDATLYDIAELVVLMVDRVTNTFSTITIAAQTGIAHAVGPSTMVYIDSLGVLSNESFAGLFDNTRRRTELSLAVVIHNDGSNINNVVNTISNYAGNQVTDGDIAMGDIRYSGLRVAANGANLSINREAGVSHTPFYPNLYTNPADPYLLSLAAQNAASFFYSWLDAAEPLGWKIGALTTVMDVGSYDDLTGNGTGGTPDGTVPSNRWSVTLVVEASGQIGLQYGQALYTSLQNAVDNFRDDPFTLSPFYYNTATRAYIIAKGDATDLTAAIAAGDAKIVFPRTNLVTERPA